MSSTNSVEMVQEVILVESLKLDDVPAGMYNVHCLHLRLPGAEGAPIRCILIKWSPSCKILYKWFITTKWSVCYHLLLVSLCWEVSQIRRILLMPKLSPKFCNVSGLPPRSLCVCYHILLVNSKSLLHSLGKFMVVCFASSFPRPVHGLLFFCVGKKLLHFTSSFSFSMFGGMRSTLVHNF